MNQLQLHKPLAGPQGVNVKEFLAFLGRRPKEEHWELIDGAAVKKVLPTLAHNLIAGNLLVLLTRHFRAKSEDLYAFSASYVRIPKLDNFLPQPDVMVAPAPAGNEVYSEKFRLVGEVLSPSNRKREIGLKLRRYKEHALCEHVLVLDSRRIWLELHSRSANWRPQLFTDAKTLVELSAFALKRALRRHPARLGWTRPLNCNVAFHQGKWCRLRASNTAALRWLVTLARRLIKDWLKSLARPIS